VYGLWFDFGVDVIVKMGLIFVVVVFVVIGIMVFV